MQSHQLFAFASILWIGGCGPRATGCRDDSECGAGACVAGECRMIAGADLAMEPRPDGAAVDSATTGADLVGRPVDGSGAIDAAGDSAAPTCQFNGDGTIDRSEAPLLVGLGGFYVVNAPMSTVPVMTVPKGGTWDFSAPVANERKVFDELLAPGGLWWAADFPGATFAERLDDGQALFGVFRAHPDRLELMGIVSDQGGLTRTSLKYGTPIPVLRFPLAMGTTWTAESTLSGVVNGVLFAGSDKYVFTVDGKGATKVPAGTFQTLRLRSNYTQTVGFVSTKRIQYLHLAECYGAVARLRSKDDEGSNEFAQAVEYRRLAAP